MAFPLQAQDAETFATQWDAYEAVRAKSVIELQPFRRTQQAVDPATGQTITLINLNPATNAWFLLQITPDGGGDPVSYHLENPFPKTQQITLDPATPPAVLMTRKEATHTCGPWAEDQKTLKEARAKGLAYVGVCEDALLLRNPVIGARTNIEATAEFLRDNIWGGESIVRFVRDNFYRDSEVEISKTLGTGGTDTVASGPPAMHGSKAPEDMPVVSTLLDIALEDAKPGRMTIGQWYPVEDLHGVYASAFQPRWISQEVLNGPGKTNWIDNVESKATGYMVAFDLDQLEMGFAMGTDHPALGWSPRPPASIRPKGMPGPDGIKSPRPLVLLGMVNKEIANRSIATFTAGFKRSHGAFKYGDMAGFNLGHHYGFIEKGVILSKLQPNLSTLFGLTDGTIQMKTWTEADNALLPRIEFARQNGVPLLETDPETGLGVPGDRVTQWGPGNWSGSAKAELRTLRAGGCIVKDEGRQFLLYGYFSTATPSAMARTFQAYGCSYAMLLDMNALEHTYLALYVPRDGQVHVQHMVPGMALIDKKVRGGGVIPRFIGFADNRDLFYVMRKEGTP
ncbi:hypothetical protein [Shimia sp. SDUM112013]|uniref:hypothetical protein n=1 Tax=Shimia sp. SDUM112013 TaxID=3136160 RepID=UPI0032EAEDC9